MGYIYNILKYVYFYVTYYLIKVKARYKGGRNICYDNRDYYTDRDFTSFLSEMDKLALSKKESNDGK